MKLYLDTSALVKLVVLEAESQALRDYLRVQASDVRFTAALARAELIRTVSRRGSAASITHARRVLSRLDTVAMTDRLLDTAATIPPPELRTLDALHLAAATTAVNDLRALVTYDTRLADAATQVGITVVQPQ